MGDPRRKNKFHVFISVLGPSYYVTKKKKKDKDQTMSGDFNSHSMQNGILF